MKRSLLTNLLFLCLLLSSKAQSILKDSSILVFPKTRLYPVVFLDPLECQIGGGSYLLSRDGSDLNLYSLVNFGFTKPILAKRSIDLSWEINFGAATFTQFDLINKDNGVYLAGLLNNDYKISLDYIVQKKSNLLKFRIFHVSSHLGDDYMLRHNDSLPNDKSVNYEQADITFLKLKRNDYWYISLGEIYTKFVFRKRFSINGGGIINYRKLKPISFFNSINVKVFAQNNFRPDIRAALGVSFNRKTESMAKIWFEYYNGQLPYSTLDYGRVSWIGLALWVNVY
jgi:hypothetical protein